MLSGWSWSWWRRLREASVKGSKWSRISLDYRRAAMENDKILRRQTGKETLLKEFAHMGFAKYLEDITDRYYENTPLSDWRTYLGSSSQRRDVEEAKFLFGDPLDRPRRLIRDFSNYY